MISHIYYSFLFPLSSLSLFTLNSHVLFFHYLGWELTWSFSLWLEAVAVIPQISILNKTTKVEPFTAHYIASLGTYRFFYIINWIYRYYTEHVYCWTSIITGILQSLLYADFLYLYFRKYFIFNIVFMPLLIQIFLLVWIAKKKLLNRVKIS